MIFFNSPKIKNFFLQLILNYKMIIFKKSIKLNFANGICVIFKHDGSKEELKEMYLLLVLISEELRKVPQLN